MPGPVEQLTNAADEVERYALQNGEDHELVKKWFYENLQVERSSHPQETYSQTVRHAVDVTKHEIRENADIHWEQEREEMQTHESIRQNPFAALKRDALERPARTVHAQEREIEF